jgi:hypothetical protein
MVTSGGVWCRLRIVEGVSWYNGDMKWKPHTPIAQRKNMNETKENYKEEINHSDIGNNLGELFGEAKKVTKMGTKIGDKKAEIKNITEMVKAMNIDDGFEVNRAKLKSILELTFSGNDLGRHYKYMEQRTTSQGCLEYAYNLILMREESLRKLESKFNDEFE